MIRYLIEFAIIHSFLAFAYWLFLKHESQYARLRTYLICSTLLALLVPVLRLPSIQSFFIQEDQTTFMYQLDPVSYIPLEQSAQSDFGTGPLLWLFALVSCWFLYRIILGLIYLVRLRAFSKYEEINGIGIRKVDHLKGSFSFFEWIFVSGRIDEDREAFLPIVKHEYAHVRLGHSYDLLLFQLFRMIFWWLPSTWYILKEIKKIHEFQADAYALKSYSLDQYSSVLISSTLKSNGLSLASSFHDGLILKRLKAMKQNVKQINPWKLSSLGVLVTLLVIIFACNEELDREIKKMGEASNAISFDQLPPDMQKNLADIQGDLSFMKVVMTEDQKPRDMEELQGLDPTTIHMMNVDKNAGEIYIAIKKDGANFDYLSNQSKMDDEVFTIVEDQPEFPGGMNAFYQYVAENMQYPQKARKAGISGRVYVQFIVNKDGSVSDVKAVKGIGGGCDEEAVRVVSGSQNWNPGMQRGQSVKVRMVMPVIFKIAGSDTPSSSGNPTNTMEEMVVVGYGDQGDGIGPESGGAANFVKHEKFIVAAKHENGAWKGTVIDSETGKPLPGANIVVAGTSKGTVSDLKGNYKIEASEDTELVVSFVGYESVRVKNK